MQWSNIDFSILSPALVAGVIVLVTHVPLGRQVLSRGIIFIDLAVAQIAGLGVIAAEALFHAEEGWLVQLCAVVAALAGSCLLYWLGKRFPKEQEALIGVVFVMAATGAVLLLHNNPHGGEHLKELLSGQILWVSWDQLLVAALLTLAIAPIWWCLKQWKSELSFYLTFALAVTISVQLVGVYLVFASLIIPALAVRHKAGIWAIVIGFIVAALAYLAGLLISALSDWPTSPVIVWCLAAAAVITSSLSRAK